MNEESERASRPSQEPRRARWTRPRLRLIRIADTEDGPYVGLDGVKRS